MKCKNCHTTLSTEAFYCPTCGGKIIRNRLTIKSILQSFSEQFLNYDNKFLQTFINLFKNPEDVIGGYINGTRKKYVNVVSYFAIAIAVSGFFFFVLNKFFPNVLSSMYGITDMKPQQAEINTKISHFTTEYQSMVMFASVPLMAVLSRLTFLKNKKYNFAEHLIINLYAYSQVSLVSSLLLFTSSIFIHSIAPYIPFAIMVFQFLFYAYVLKKLYDLSLKQIVLKSLLFILIATVIFIPLIIVISGILYFLGFYDGIIEAAKAKKEMGYLAVSVLNWIS